MSFRVITSWLRLLPENSPREWTPAYCIHRIRESVKVSFTWFLPLVVGLLYAGFGTIVVSPYFLNDGDDALQCFFVIAVVACSSGVSASLGMHALWKWMSARVYQFLDDHPQSQISIARDYRLPAKGESKEPRVVLGETHPIRNYSPRAADSTIDIEVCETGYELQFTPAEQYSPTPEWAILSARSLVTGMLILGSPGSGKTAYVLRPSVFKLFHHPGQPGGLVMDAKADLVAPLIEEMRAVGREEDVLAIGPDRPTRWNPLHAPLSDPSTIANMLLTNIENLNGAAYRADSLWIRDGAAYLAEGSIGLLRLHSGYVTAAAIRSLLDELTLTTEGSDAPGDAARSFINSMFIGHSAPSDRHAEYKHYLQLIVGCFSENEKFRGIYRSELMRLLIPLTSPAVVEKYNAPEQDLDMPDWSEVINKGLVVVLDCHTRAYPRLAKILGMFLKLGYQDSMLIRLDWERKGLCNKDRYLCLVIDEYQDYASPNDSDYLALCRQSKSMTIFMTQGFDSIIEKIGPDRSKVLLQSISNRLILRQDEPEFAAKLLGQHEISQFNTTVAESISDASLHATGRFAGASSVSESHSEARTRKHVVPPEEVKKIPLGQGILQGFDGTRALPLRRVYLRPYFAPDDRHADLNIKRGNK